MATYRRFRVQRKYVNGKPTDETRLGEQIDSTDYPSLEECKRGSGCTNLEYRWVDVQNEYICENFNKYKKQRREQRCVGTNEWVAIYPYEYQKGEIIENDSVDCGYGPSVERHIYGTTDGHGSINISPSKEYYSSTDVVTITALPSTDYVFSCYNYGSTSEYGKISTNSTLMLTMTHDWYVSAEFSYSLSLYYLYTSINGEGSIMVTPSKNEYSRQEHVNILAFPSANYMFEYYEYGSTPAYGSTALRANLDLTMSNDWYVKANFVSGTASSESLYYSYYTGSETWYNWGKSTLSKIDNNGSLASIIIDYGGVVLSLPSRAFSSQSYLTTVNLPNCKSLDTYAFYYCPKLISVNLPNCTYIDGFAFEGCKSLTSIDLPNCSYINGGAFYDCHSLLSIDLPLCEYVANNAFEYCYSLSSVNLPNCKYVDDAAFRECSVLPSIDLPNCSYVGNGTFSNCSALSSVNLPLCEYVGGYAFEDCSLLTSIDLPNCSYVGDRAFGWCSALSIVNLPLCEYIGGAFYSCISLTSIDLPNCKSIDNEAFGLCSRLQSVNLPLCEYLDFSTFIGCYSLTSVNLPLCKHLGHGIFYHCSALQSIDLPNCSYFDDAVFYGCEALTSINIPLCQSIGHMAFRYCSALTSISLSLCTYVGSYAFERCRALQSVNLPLCSYVNSSAFTYCSALITVNLPLCETVDDYAFQSCYSLASIDLPNCTSVSAFAFSDCSKLSIVHLPKVTCFNRSVFETAPIETLYMDQITSVPSGYDPYINRSYIKSIFIPSSLLNKFVSHSIWSKYSSYFVCV